MINKIKYTLSVTYKRHNQRRHTQHRHIEPMAEQYTPIEDGTVTTEIEGEDFNGMLMAALG